MENSYKLLVNILIKMRNNIFCHIQWKLLQHECSYKMAKENIFKGLSSCIGLDSTLLKNKGGLFLGRLVITLQSIIVSTLILQR